MKYKELIDQVSLNLLKKSGKIESQKSLLAIRNYLEQLDIDQLKLLQKESTQNPNNKCQYSYNKLNLKFQ